MEKIILDVQVILKYPDILKVVKEGTEIIISTEVVSELQTLMEPEIFMNVLELIKKNKSIRLVNAYDSKYDINPDMFSFMDLNDKSLFRIGYGETDLGALKLVKIATFDHDIIRNAVESYLGTINEVELKILIKIFSSKRNRLRKFWFEEKNRRFIVNSLMLFVAIIIFSAGYLLLFEKKVQNYIFYNFKNTTLTYLLYGITAIIITITMFFFRDKASLYYGIVEVLVGLMSCGAAFEKFDSNFVIKLLGGLYIMVRGWDNINKNIHVNKMYNFWYKRMKKELYNKFKLYN